ncbi:hypothetical protein ACFQEQ_07625 [Halolamina salina]|uniref:hypothetical protein n=1 Tax=Halolamina salina TaxID=1220023 RepID=UPI003608DA19
MPSTRRRLLATAATGGTILLAGCTGQLPGTGPRRVDAVDTGGERELVWQYPAAEVEEHDDGVGYGSVTFEGDRSSDGGSGRLAFELNTTVGGIAATEAYTDYEADWARFRLGPPNAYTATHPFEMWVQPPTGGFDLRTGYDHRAGRRELVVELPGIDTGGTITLPVLFDPSDDAVPDLFHCSFTVEASEPGAFGETVRASSRGTIEIAAARS